MIVVNDFSFDSRAKQKYGTRQDEKDIIEGEEEEEQEEETLSEGKVDNELEKKEEKEKEKS
jgi:hypothetical protein